MSLARLLVVGLLSLLVFATVTGCCCCCGSVRGYEGSLWPWWMEAPVEWLAPGPGSDL